MRDPVSGGHEWTPEQRDAVQRVRYVERAMSLTGAAGGFLVPYELDPNILISSAPAMSIRCGPSPRRDDRATTRSGSSRSLGVTSHWYAEAAEVTDDSPTLFQPASPARRRWRSCPSASNSSRTRTSPSRSRHVFADSKAAEEARVFTVGVTASNEPNGIITALVAAGGGTIIATGTNVLAQGDLYANQAALPPRWRANARWMMNLSILNGYRQLPQATGLNYSIVNDTGPTPKALGWEIRENSNMDGTLTGAAADYLVLSGDFRQYAIVDRVGTTIEVVPQLLGANRRPSGQRGFLMHWRVGADVLIADAFRLSNFST